MRFEAVTTCSAKGWQEYGKRMSETFHTHWPAEVPLRLYSEDLQDAQPMPGWLAQFKARHAKNENAHGNMRRGRSSRTYNYRFDAVRFAHKVAVVIEAARVSPADILIWVDADTVTHAPVTLEFLLRLAPGPKDVIAWLDRAKSYPECGFYMLNLRNMLTLAMLQQWKSLYTDDRLFHLPEWHDSFVLAEVVRAMQCPWKSLSGDAAATGHPFINGPLGAVMDHLKGPRKVLGKSTKHDLKVQRTEAYWSGK